MRDFRRPGDTDQGILDGRVLTKPAGLGTAVASAMVLLPLGTLPASGPAFAADAFDRWVVGVRREAAKKGVKKKTLDAAFKGVRPIPRVIALLKRQPEFTMTLDRYLRLVVSKQRVALGRKNYRANRKLLLQASRRFGVQPQFIVALWGVETKYGAITGDFPVVGALSTLAYQGSRRRYFRSELINALRILQQGHITPARMKGSWAGAMGQNQFMPSSFLNYAVDQNRDGRRDIWTTRADVFGSTANYLSREGWKTGQTWGREVRLPAKFNQALANNRRARYRLARWSKLGVRRVDGSPLPKANLRARLLIPRRSGGRAFLTYHNFNVILRWNRSNYFAIAVGQLADRIAAPPRKRATRG